MSSNIQESVIIAASKFLYRDAIEKYSKIRRLINYIYVDSPQSLDQALNQAKSIRYIFFIHWNWKVPEEIISKYECVCFHMTDVPYGRGGSPLQNLILRGHQTTWLSALRMTDEIDAGPVYTKQKLTLDGRAEDIYKRAAMIAMDIIEWMIKVHPVPKPQIGEPTYFKRRHPEESELLLKGGLEEVNDFIRMLDAPGYPKAFINHGEYRIEFANPKLREGKLTASVHISKIKKDKDDENNH
jgi:methionyl-tRNA formyltransferase